MDLDTVKGWTATTVDTAQSAIDRSGRVGTVQTMPSRGDGGKAPQTGCKSVATPKPKRDVWRTTADDYRRFAEREPDGSLVRVWNELKLKAGKRGQQ